MATPSTASAIPQTSIIKVRPETGELESVLLSPALGELDFTNCPRSEFREIPGCQLCVKGVVGWLLWQWKGQDLRHAVGRSPFGHTCGASARAAGGHQVQGAALHAGWRIVRYR